MGKPKKRNGRTTAPLCPRRFDDRGRFLACSYTSKVNGRRVCSWCFCRVGKHKKRPPAPKPESSVPVPDQWFETAPKGCSLTVGEWRSAHNSRWWGSKRAQRPLEALLAELEEVTRNG